MRRSASEIINDLESRIARLEKRATAYSQDIPISRKQLKDAKRDITEEFGEWKYDGNYGYVGKEDLNLGSWVRLYSSKTKEGLSIFLLSTSSSIFPYQTYYAVFKEYRPNRYREVGLYDFEGDAYTRYRSLHK